MSRWRGEGGPRTRRYPLIWPSTCSGRWWRCPGRNSWPSKRKITEEWWSSSGNEDLFPVRQRSPFLFFYFFFLFCIFTISTKHALYNIVLLYHSIIYSFNLKLWSGTGLTYYDPIVPCHFNVGVKSVELTPFFIFEMKYFWLRHGIVHWQKLAFCFRLWITVFMTFMFVNKLMCNQSFSVVQENVLYLYFLIKN